MVKIQASCRVIGNNFSPAAFAKLWSVPLVDAHEPGTFGNTGRYRGMPKPYGSASIEVSNKAEKDWSRFDDLLTVLESCIHTLREAGAEDVYIICSLFHDGQCNFDFTKEQLRRIGVLEIDLLISCYPDDVE